MKRVRQIFKFILILNYILLFSVNLLLIRIIYSGRLWNYRKAMHPFMQFWVRRGVELIGVNIHIKGSPIQKENNFLVVSNHLSYLDTLILAAQFPTNFVTSMEIRQTPVLGFLTEMGGCLYVERRNKQNIHNEIEDITQALNFGLNVTIFPEATSTNGESVLRFRQPLYNAAIKSQKWIKPLCINYQSINGVSVDRENRDLLFWYGDMAFLPHLWKLMSVNDVNVELEFLEDLTTLEIQEAKVLAERSHQLVKGAFLPVV